MVGGQIGYNYQINQLVLGVEGSLDWSDLSKSRTFGDGSTDSLKVNSFAHRPGRGWATPMTAPCSMSLAVTPAATFTPAPSTTPSPGSSYPGGSSWQNGYAIGGGIEYAITNNVSVKGEYLFSQLGSKTYYGGSPDVVKAGLDINTFTVGRQLQVLSARHYSFRRARRRFPPGFFIHGPGGAASELRESDRLSQRKLLLPEKGWRPI